MFEATVPISIMFFIFVELSIAALGAAIKMAESNSPTIPVVLEGARAFRLIHEHSVKQNIQFPTLPDDIMFTAIAVVNMVRI